MTQMSDDHMMALLQLELVYEAGVSVKPIEYSWFERMMLVLAAGLTETPFH